MFWMNFEVDMPLSTATAVSYVALGTVYYSKRSCLNHQRCYAPKIMSALHLPICDARIQLEHTYKARMCHQSNATHVTVQLVGL